MNNQISVEKPSSSSVVFTQQEFDFKAILVVYKTNEGVWRGFIHPYGETTEADSKEEAIKKLRLLADAYHEVIKTYGSPIHLRNGHLEDVQDREVFSWVTRNGSIMEKISSGKDNVDTTNCYVETYGRESK